MTVHFFTPRWTAQAFTRLQPAPRLAMPMGEAPPARTRFGARRAFSGGLLLALLAAAGYALWRVRAERAARTRAARTPARHPVATPAATPRTDPARAAVVASGAADTVVRPGPQAQAPADAATPSPVPASVVTGASPPAAAAQPTPAVGTAVGEAVQHEERSASGAGSEAVAGRTSTAAQRMRAAVERRAPRARFWSTSRPLPGSPAGSAIPAGRGALPSPATRSGTL